MDYLFRIHGSIGRGTYCQALINYLVAIILVRLFCSLWARASSDFQIWGMLAAGLACVAIAISFLLVSRQRLRDLGKGDGWLLAYFAAPAILVALGYNLARFSVGISNIIGGSLPPLGIGLMLWGVVELAVFPSKAQSS